MLGEQNLKESRTLISPRFHSKQLAFQEVNRAMAAAKGAIASSSQKAREAEKEKAQVEREKNELQEKETKENHREKEENFECFLSNQLGS